MLFHILHELHYAYDRPVFLEPHTLRLTPRQDAGQRLLRHQLALDAPAAGRCPVQEPEGSEGVVLWFNDKREQLKVLVESEVETLRHNPFDWIISSDAARRLPVEYGPQLTASLAPCLVADVPPAVRAWGAEIATAVDQDTMAFLMELADRIHHGFHHVGRLDGDPWPAERTLAERSGACRDTALLYMAVCRSQGLAARFVSGYSCHHPPEVTEHELHAWAEVYVPGGGWRGYDPSLGLAVADGHVVLAAAADPAMAAPLSGSYRGTGASSQLSYTVRLEVLDEPTAGEADPGAALASSPAHPPA